MNLSGLSVRELVRDRRIEPRNIVIVYDDLDIPLGAIRVRAQGTAGTHNGMRSVVQETGATAFPRVRIGIGPLPADADAADYVLSPFSRAEKEVLAGALDEAREALFMILDGDIKGAMKSSIIRARTLDPPSRKGGTGGFLGSSEIPPGPPFPKGGREA